MSVISNQSPKPPKKEQTVYHKFQKAHENMSNFQQMLTKFSTAKKSPVPINPQIHPFTTTPPQHNDGPETLILSDGWSYIGEIFQQKFHGFGNLILDGGIVYSGQFSIGKLNGQGTLFYNPIFEQLIGLDAEWLKYEGEFKQGQVTGYGNLYLTDGLVVVAKWKNGKPFYCTKVNGRLLSKGANAF